MQVHSRVKKRATLNSALATSHCPLLHFIQERQRNIRTKKPINTVWATRHFRDTQNTLNTGDRSYLSPFRITLLLEGRIVRAFSIVTYSQTAAFERTRPTVRKRPAGKRSSNAAPSQADPVFSFTSTTTALFVDRPTNE